MDARAITDIDFSAAHAIRDLLTDLTNHNITLFFARGSAYLRDELDRSLITPAAHATYIFSTFQEGIDAVRAALGTGVRELPDGAAAPPTSGKRRDDAVKEDL